MMPLHVLRHFFGDQWVEQHLYGEGFLKPPSKFVDRQKQQQVGLAGYQLAEALFNLQEVEGFAGVHTRLLAGELEPCIGELDAAGFLKRRRERIRFVIPRGSLGDDYDLVMSRDEIDICCEVKVKLEAETLTEKGAFNSLEQARRQLPKDKPGLIFLRVVGNTNRADLRSKAELIQRAVQRLFAQTQRVVRVILLTRVYEYVEGYQMARDLWRTIPNSKSKYPVTLLDEFKHKHIIVDLHSPDWTYMAPYHPRVVHSLL